MGPSGLVRVLVLQIMPATSSNKPYRVARSKTGLSPPPLPDDLLGLLTILVIPVQLLLITVAMVGFNQEWHVEEERPIGDELPPVDPPRGTSSRRAGQPSGTSRTSRSGSRTSQMSRSSTRRSTAPRRPRKA